MNLDKIEKIRIANKKSYLRRKQEQKQAQQRLQLHRIISSLMFSNGDGPEPFVECRDFMLAIVRKQLMEMLIQKAQKLATERGKTTIGPLEVVFAFRRHPILIKRLIAYVNITEMMPKLMDGNGNDGGDGVADESIPVEFNNFGELIVGEDNNGTKEDNKEDENWEEESTKDATESSAGPSTSSTIQKKPKKRKRLGSKKMKNSAILLAAIAEFDVLGHLLDEFGPGWVDPIKMERMRRIDKRTKEMDVEMYTKFANARQMASFCGAGESTNNNKLGGNANKNMKLFLEWLGQPPLDDGTCCPLILNFCAIEIVAILVDGALICRHEQEMATAGTGMESDASKNDAIQQNCGNDEPIKLCHYEEALRRNRGYARRGDLLFGNF